MKLSAVILVGVNILALSPVPAQAADTASFLTESLQELQPMQAPPAKLMPAAATQHTRKAQSRIAHSATAGQPVASKKHGRTGYTAMTAQADTTIKLRPFIPGRHLPSTQDLHPQYVSMAPKVDPAGGLYGQVSTSASAYQVPTHVPQYHSGHTVPQDGSMKRLAEAAVKKVCQAASRRPELARAVPGMAPVMPGQVQPPADTGYPSHGGSSSDFSTPAWLLPGNKQQVQVPQPPTMPQDAAQLAAMPIMVPSPVLAPYDDRQMERMMMNNMPERLYGQSFNGEMRGSVQGNPGLAGAGPPPFPLSFAQGQSPAMRTGRSGNMPMTSQQARFGSWHDNMHLPQTGFHSYVGGRMSGPINPQSLVAAQGSNHSRKTGKQTRTVSGVKARVAQASAAPSSRPSKQERAVYSYNSYRRYPG